MSNKNKKLICGLEIEPMEFYDPNNPPTEDMKKWSMEHTAPQSSSKERVMPTVITSTINNMAKTESNTIKVNLGTQSPKQPLMNIPQNRQFPVSKIKSHELSALEVATKFSSLVPTRIHGSTITVYNGVFYQKVTELDMKRLIRKVCEKDIFQAKSPSFIKQIFDFLMLQPELIFPDVPFSTAISFEDGVLDLRDNSFHPHSPNHFTRYLIQCNYLKSNNLQCPNFEKFLSEVTCEDEVLQKRIWETIGYLITPDMSAKKLFLFQGVPNSGKSVLSHLLRSLFNAEAVSALDIHSLSERFSAATLESKALCLSPDLPSGVLNNKSTSKLKQLTGNDIVSADVLYSSPIEYKSTTKFVLATNHPLLTQEYDEAFEDRIITIPFAYTIPQEKRDPALLTKLIYERTAIVRKALNAYYELRDRYYIFSGDYPLNATSALYDNDSAFDVKTCIYSFLKTHFVEDSGGGIFISDAHKAFIGRYDYIAVNTFSQHFLRFASELYGATKKRDRQDVYKNPTSYIKGIRYIGGTLE